jgi:hypothetical protein
MTSNNEVKAKRPCTVWGQTFDSNTVKEVNAVSDHVYILLHGNMIDSFYVETEQDVPRILFEAIQAIANAHRPWLKAEGFQFVEGERYEVLHIHGGTLMHDLGEFGNYGGVQGIDSADFAELGYIKAFKPVVPYDPTDTPEQRLAKEQEAWDAVAGVEVYKEG